jgi:hypothetical protein
MCFELISETSCFDKLKLIIHSFKGYASEENNKQGVIICFSWTARILNHRSFCARLVRNFCVPDTAVKIDKNDKVWLLKSEK